MELSIEGSLNVCIVPGLLIVHRVHHVIRISHPYLLSQRAFGGGLRGLNCFLQEIDRSLGI